MRGEGIHDHVANRHAEGKTKPGKATSPEQDKTTFAGRHRTATVMRRKEDHFAVLKIGNQAVNHRALSSLHVKDPENRLFVFRFKRM